MRTNPDMGNPALLIDVAQFRGMDVQGVRLRLAEIAGQSDIHSLKTFLDVAGLYHTVENEGSLKSYLVEVYVERQLATITRLLREMSGG